MIAGLWRRLAGATSEKPSQSSRKYRIPDGEIVYAVGDVHGRLDLLKQAVDAIFQHAAKFPAALERRIVFLGDYVDRGPDSAGTIEYLLTHRFADFVPTFLRGNHEQAMLDFFDSPNPDSAWLNYGGVAALASYGIAAADRPLSEIRDEMRARMPAMHLDFLRRTEYRKFVGDYLFVHAGIRPGIPFERQDPQDFLWIREPFLSEPEIFPSKTERFVFRVVHGHTITEYPDVRPNRIGIDTGAYASGVLTVLALWEDKLDFIHA